MEQRDSFKKSILSSIADFALVLASVGIVGITYLSVSGLSPVSKQRYADNGSQVLGESTTKTALQVFAGEESVPFISSYTLKQGTSISDNAKLDVGFESLEATTYTFRAASLKNPGNTDMTVRVTPSFSIPGSYTTITLVFAGLEQEIVSTNGLISPLDLAIPANTIADITLKVQPSTRLATKSLLSLDFTEIR